MDKVREAKDSFDRFTMLIANDDAAQYRLLMGGTLHDYVRSAESYLRRVAAIKKQTKKARHG